jgi:HlyD family secretion protein
LYQTETIISVNNEIQKIKTDFESLQERKGSLEFNIDKSVIKATKTGSLALTQDYSIGDYIEAGLVIGTIIPDDGKTLKVQMYVSNNDIGLINIGDKVKYKFDALSYKEYGVLEGQIDKISVDSQKSNSQTPSYYLVETTLNNEKLYSYKGLEAEMRVGMTLEAHTVTERKKVLLYLLEKIDLWG